MNYFEIIQLVYMAYTMIAMSIQLLHSLLKK
jgi:hypothetical protein